MLHMLQLANLIHSDEGLMLEMSAFEFLYGGQFILSTQLRKQHYLSYNNTHEKISRF